MEVWVSWKDTTASYLFVLKGTGFKTIYFIRHDCAIDLSA